MQVQQKGYYISTGNQNGHFGWNCFLVVKDSGCFSRNPELDFTWHFKASINLDPGHQTTLLTSKGTMCAYGAHDQSREKYPDV